MVARSTSERSIHSSKREHAALQSRTTVALYNRASVMSALLFCSACAAFTSVHESSGPSTRGPFQVIAHFKIGGDGSWDYLAVDTASNRLFITRENRVVVLDRTNGHVLGQIGGLDHAHGVAFAYGAGHGFATSGTDSTVVMFDLTTLKVLARTIAAPDADAVLYDPASNHVFTFDGDAGMATAIDPASGARVASIPLEGKPEFGVSDDDGELYVNLEDKAEVVEIDARAMSVRRRWSLAPCHTPTGLAIDRTNGILFSGCRSGVMAISDARAGKVIAILPIGTGVDATAFDPVTGDAFASNADGTINVIHEDGRTQFHVEQTVVTAPGAKTMALDPQTHRIYTDAGILDVTSGTSRGVDRARIAKLLPGSFAVLVLARRK